MTPRPLNLGIGFWIVFRSIATDNEIVSVNTIYLKGFGALLLAACLSQCALSKTALISSMDDRVEPVFFVDIKKYQNSELWGR